MTLRRVLPDASHLQKALWLGGILLAITCSYTLVKVARDALFLSRVSARSLPLVYVLVGCVTLAIAWVFGRLTHRLSPLRTLALTALISALVLVGFGCVFPLQLTWIPTAYYVWVNVYGLLLTSQFWIFTNSISDPREAKHIFGIVGGGGILGGLLGGITAARFGQVMPLPWLPFIAAGLLVAMAVLVWLASRRGRMSRLEEPEPEGAPEQLARVSYVRWLALATLCSVIITGLIDYQFKVVIQVRYPNAADLASFFGRFFVAMNIAALALQLIATRWLLQRVGAAPLAVVLPAGLAVGATTILAAPGFWSVIGTRLWDQVLRFSLHKSTNELFYFPLGANVRRRAKALIEAGIERFADGLSGIIILLAGLVLDTRPVTLAAIAVVLVTVWIFSWIHLRRGYVLELGRSLRRMNLDPKANTVSLRERSVLKELARTLDSPYERVVEQAMEALEENGAGALIDARLPRLLEHPSPRVRARVLERAAARPTAEVRRALTRLIGDQEPLVRLQALRVHLALEGGSLEPLEEFLASSDPDVRGTALASLVEHAGPEDLPRVRDRLAGLLAGSDPVDRALAAEALGARAEADGLHDLLHDLLADPDPVVRAAAFRSVGRAGMREHVDELILGLGEREASTAALDGLLAFGEGAVGTLGDWLGDSRVAIEIRREIPRVLRDRPTLNAMVGLFRVRGHEDVILDYRVLKAMNRIRAANSSLTFPRDLVEEDLEYDVRELLVAELHAVSQRGADEVADRFLLRVLSERREQALNRVFRRLALIYPPRSMFAAYHALHSAEARVHGRAVEYVETALSPEHRAWVMPLLGESRDRAEFARERFGLEPLPREASLAALLEANDPWLRACALYVAGRRRARPLLARVEANLDARDARVRETAGWAKLAITAA